MPTVLHGEFASSQTSQINAQLSQIKVTFRNSLSENYSEICFWFYNQIMGPLLILEKALRAF